eukprot:TRINITY_DN2378_c0_g4_i1.p2 TRINITY_DN2378_c0_g4~~TRINITY_DN2378_c0_g4_i1.p2  ORF type:complete len:138 (+),score=0.70 TRINITY_DN2378_c0_g4_i1:176-589(+)
MASTDTETSNLSYKSLLCASATNTSPSLMEPRGYQKALIDFAKKRNTIIYLGTGLGKTLISIYVIKNLFNEEPSVNKLSGSLPIRRKSGNSPKVITVQIVGFLRSENTQSNKAASKGDRQVDGSESGLLRRYTVGNS